MLQFGFLVEFLGSCIWPRTHRV